MRTYVWSCFSCGMANPPEAQWCQRCECPARATVAEMTRYRRQFEGESHDPLALDNGIVRGVAIFLFIVASGLTSYAAPLSVWLVAGAVAIVAAALWRLSETPNRSIERTSSGKAPRPRGAAVHAAPDRQGSSPTAASHVKR